MLFLYSLILHINGSGVMIFLAVTRLGKFCVSPKVITQIRGEECIVAV